MEIRIRDQHSASAKTHWRRLRPWLRLVGLVAGMGSIVFAISKTVFASEADPGLTALQAGGPVIIGATLPQARFLTCVAQVSADELRNTPNSNERLTIVVLEHQKFLETREGFHAHKTALAFSSLLARRIYLSSRMFGDFETLLRCITHELGHFATQSVYEDHAELAAERLRKTARQRCASEVQ
jgi:hypothetical protein